MTDATAAVTLALLFTEWQYAMYREGFTLAKYVLSTRIGLHRIELVNKTLVNDDFSKFSIYLCYKSQVLKNLAFKVIRIRIYNT